MCFAEYWVLRRISILKMEKSISQKFRCLAYNYKYFKYKCMFGITQTVECSTKGQLYNISEVNFLHSFTILLQRDCFSMFSIYALFSRLMSLNAACLLCFLKNSCELTSLCLQSTGCWGRREKARSQKCSNART